MFTNELPGEYAPRELEVEAPRALEANRAYTDSKTYSRKEPTNFILDYLDILHLATYVERANKELELFNIRALENGNLFEVSLLEDDTFMTHTFLLNKFINLIQVKEVN